MATDQSILNLLYSGTTTALDFHYENLCAPPILSFLTIQDIEELRKIATSVRLSGDVDKKYQMINDIMKIRGFKKLAAGTNRVVYYHPDVPHIVMKIAMDRVGMNDNPAEFYNQRFIKPFCCKVFEVSPCGTVGLFERVDRITSKYEFLSIAEDVFWVITKILVGKYVLNDIGAKFMYNWGVRRNFGPVILDFPYLYELDGAKLYCDQTLEDGSHCGGEIDYDVQFNFLVCKKCGKQYDARELSKPHKESGILIRSKGGLTEMKVMFVRGNQIVATNDQRETTEVMKKPTAVKPDNNGKIRGRVVGDQVIESENDIRREAVFTFKRGNKYVSSKQEEKIEKCESSEPSGVFEFTRKTRKQIDEEKSKNQLDAFADMSGAVVVEREEKKPMTVVKDEDGSKKIVAPVESKKEYEDGEPDSNRPETESKLNPNRVIKQIESDPVLRTVLIDYFMNKDTEFMNSIKSIVNDEMRKFAVDYAQKLNGAEYEGDDPISELAPAEIADDKPEAITSDKPCDYEIRAEETKENDESSDIVSSPNIGSPIPIPAVAFDDEANEPVKEETEESEDTNNDSVDPFENMETADRITEEDKLQPSAFMARRKSIE